MTVHLVENVRIIDLIQILAESIGTMHLGDLSTEIVKIKHLNCGDICLAYSPHVDNLSSQFAAINQNRYSVR